MPTISVELDRVSVVELIDRYGKSKLYRYFKVLGITTIRDGLQSYISPEQDDLVTQYHQAKGIGGETLSRFLAALYHNLNDGNVSNVLEQTQEMGLPASLKRSELAVEHSFEAAVLGMLQALAQQFAPQPDPLARAEALAQACRHDLILRTSEVKQIVGVVPRGDRFLSDGFVFVRAGKWRREVSWRVERI